MKLRKNLLRPIRLDIEQFLSLQSAAVRAEWNKIAERVCLTKDQILASHATAERDNFQFYDAPERLLEQYKVLRQQSELGRIFLTANAIQADFDRVVVLNIGGSNLAAQALIDSCCQPFWNELRRGERGSKPGLYFLHDRCDNDEVAGLLRLLSQSAFEPLPTQAAQRWALVVVIEKAAARTADAILQVILDAYQSQGFSKDMSAQGLVLISDLPEEVANERFKKLSPTFFCLSSKVEPKHDWLSIAGLLPAALLGVNLIELLQGASQANLDFKNLHSSVNVAIQQSALYLNKEKSTHEFNIYSPHRALKSIVSWSAEQSETVNLSNCWSAADQIWLIDQCRFDPLKMSGDASEMSLHQQTQLRYQDLNHCNLHLPELNDLQVGYLMQTLMLVNFLCQTFKG